MDLRKLVLQRGGEKMYQLPMLAKVPGLMHGFLTHKEGNQGYGFGDPRWRVIENRAQFLRAVCPTRDEFPFLSSVCMAPLQKGHEEEIRIVGPGDVGRGMDGRRDVPCEAMVTDSPNILLYLAVADCLPVILLDPQKGILALVHAGRESTLRKIPVKTIRMMQEKFKVDPADVLVGMGPGIRSYILQRLPAGLNDDSLWQTNCHPARRGFLLDLHGYNRDPLISAGVPEEQIEECPNDTFTDPQFFSHRRSSETGDPEGRHACAVGMVPIE